jgi:hypothetical protein
LQLTSTTDASESTPRSGPATLSKANQPLVPGIIALLAWLAFVLARWQVWARGNFARFVLLGTTYSHARYLPKGMVIGDPHAKGYDGQFYYRLAINPFNWHHTAYGITMDQSYRYTRIGYPLLAWLGSFGQHQAVPVALVVINLLCVAAMAVLGAMFAQQAGRHALWGLAFAAYFGLVISVGRDTAEPLAEACMLGGLLAYRQGRWILAAVVFAYGGLTRETILLAPLAIAVMRLIWFARGAPAQADSGRARPSRIDLAWVIPGAVQVAIQVAARLTLRGQGVPLNVDRTRNLATPFTAMTDALRFESARIDTSRLGLYDIPLLEYATLAVLVVAGLAVIYVTKARGHERLAFVLAVLQVCAMSSQIWASTFGDGRSMIEPYLFALILLLATPRRYLGAYRLGAIVVWAAPALYVVARRRVLYM